MPASQVYQWQEGLSPGTHTSELKQSKLSLLQYDEPFLQQGSGKHVDARMHLGPSCCLFYTFLLFVHSFFPLFVVVF